MDTNSPLINWWSGEDPLGVNADETSILDFVDFIAENDINVVPMTTGEEYRDSESVEESRENEGDAETHNQDIIHDNSIIAQVNRLDRVFHDITNTSQQPPSEREDYIPRITWNPDQWWINFIRSNGNHQ